MHKIVIEQLYMQYRARISLAMARAAPGECARIAHETLARLYREKAQVLQSILYLPRR